MIRTENEYRSRTISQYESFFKWIRSIWIFLKNQMFSTHVLDEKYPNSKYCSLAHGLYSFVHRASIPVNPPVRPRTDDDDSFSYSSILTIMTLPSRSDVTTPRFRVVSWSAVQVDAHGWWLLTWRDQKLGRAGDVVVRERLSSSVLDDIRLLEYWRDSRIRRQWLSWRSVSYWFLFYGRSRDADHAHKCVRAWCYDKVLLYLCLLALNFALVQKNTVFTERTSVSTSSRWLLCSVDLHRVFPRWWRETHVAS